jgi:hypothetical protein
MHTKSSTNRRPLYYIFRAWRRHPKTGEKMWARDYGLKGLANPSVRVLVGPCGRF